MTRAHEKNMPCEHPYKGYYTGNKTEKGKDEIIICCDSSEGPLNVDLATKRGFHVDLFNKEFVHSENGYFYLHKSLDIPCGRCLGCRLDYAQQWALRLSLESLYWKNSYFITLTYDDRHVGDYCLKKREAQKFLMRLQKAHPGCRYFLCGEYGSKTLRPHYHLILFMDDDLVLGDKVGVNSWLSPEISRLWSIYDRKTKTSEELGLIEVSMANPACMGYVAQYTQDKATKEDPLGRPPKFLLMSKRPAIGFRYLKEHELDFLFNDTHVYGPGGMVAPIPKAFVRKLDNDLLKAYRSELAIKSKFNFIASCMTSSRDEAGFIMRSFNEVKLKDHKRSNI